SKLRRQGCTGRRRDVSKRGRRNKGGILHLEPVDRGRKQPRRGVEVVVELPGECMRLVAGRQTIVAVLFVAGEGLGCGVVKSREIPALERVSASVVIDEIRKFVGKLRLHVVGQVGGGRGVDRRVVI